MVERVVPAFLHRRLATHAQSYCPWYPPNGFSDHTPMALLALWALGADETQLDRLYWRCVPRLETLAGSHIRLTPETWANHWGDMDAHPSYMKFFAQEASRLGVRNCLREYLPPLASGWLASTYHPLIRLGYGIEFGVASEITAGLALLACSGPDVRVQSALDRPRLEVDVATYLTRLRRSTPSRPGSTFSSRCESLLEAGLLRPTTRSARPLPDATRIALQLFDTTHDFFALHLLTGLHALCVCAPWLGPHVGDLATFGLAVGYAGLDCPPFEEPWAARQLGAGLGRSPPHSPTATSVAASALATLEDEHDIKLAHSCLAHAARFADPAYLRVLSVYLTRHHLV